MRHPEAVDACFLDLGRCSGRTAVALAVFLAGMLFAAGTGAGDWTVDFSRSESSLRPLHGVNGGPLCYRGTIDLRDAHRRLGIPLVRLHDTVWVNAEAVDIHTIFRDARADPADAANYDFRATDDYLDAVLETGARVVYRLGESIEHTPRKYWVHPPADPARWAAVCERIVAHFTDGWNGGRTNAVAYWEIWNEPDVRPAMWTGTDEQFLELFEVTARRIKARFPGAKVGGPGLGGVGEVVSGRLRPSAFAEAFLRRCRERSVPLDFFSWHRYCPDSREVAGLARAVRGWLDEGGFRGTESHLNEWNYLPDGDWRPMLKEGQGPDRDRWYLRMAGAEGAAFAAAVLARLQSCPVDAANYYTGEVQGFGLFGINGTPKKTFHAFRLFHELLATPRRVVVRAEAGEPAGEAPNGGGPRVVVVAGVNQAASTGGILVASEAAGRETVALHLPGVAPRSDARIPARVIDANREGGEEDAPIVAERAGAVVHLELSGPTVVLLRVPLR